jgi:hypothetical protein
MPTSSLPTPISARPASALPRASLCLPWPPPTRQTATPECLSMPWLPLKRHTTTPECPSNRTAGFTSAGSRAAPRPGHRPHRPLAHASTRAAASASTCTTAFGHGLPLLPPPRAPLRCVSHHRPLQHNRRPPVPALIADFSPPSRTTMDSPW